MRLKRLREVRNVRVNRPNLDFRGFSGQIVGGAIDVGDAVRALPSGKRSTVAGINTFDGPLDTAVAGQSVTLVLADEIDVSRGDVLCADADPPGIADQFEAHVVWMHDEELLPGRPYLLKLGTTTVGATLSPPKHTIDVNTLQHLAAKTLGLNEIGVCTITTDRAVTFDPYEANRDMGGFILIDRLTNATVAAGMLQFALRRSQNVHWQALDVTAQSRSDLKGHRASVLWLTGLSGSGKSTITNRVEAQLHAHGVHTFLLDGDNVRHGLNHDLGFTDADRVENVRRIAEVARLMADAGLIVLVSFISPFRAERRLARERAGEDRFVEIFIDTPLAVAEASDVKGLYAKARRGELKNFTGIDSPYEAPEDPEVRIDTLAMSPDEAADTIIQRLRQTGIIP